MPVVKKLQKKILGEIKEIQISFISRKGEFTHNIGREILDTLPHDFKFNQHKTIDTCISEIDQIIYYYNNLSTTKKNVILINFQRSKEAQTYIKGLSINFYYVLAQKTTIGTKHTYNLLQHDVFDNGKLKALSNVLNGRFSDGNKAPNPGDCLELDYTEELEEHIKELVNRLEILCQNLKNLCSEENILKIFSTNSILLLENKSE